MESSTSFSSKVSEKCEVPTASQIDTFYDKLSLCKRKPAIFSLVPAHSSEYIPSQSLSTFPMPLSQLFHPKFLELDFSLLSSEVKGIILKITTQNVEHVEEATKGQSNSKMWYKYRSGRITASNTKRVCGTSNASPSHRIVKEICYPEVFRFSTPATEWGISHEKQACELYRGIMVKTHDNFFTGNSGLTLNCDWPFLGASPDGFISCSCCGKGVLEIKCPYSLREANIIDVAKDSKYCFILILAMLIITKFKLKYTYVKLITVILLFVHFHLTLPHKFTLNARIVPDPLFWENCIGTAPLFFMFHSCASFLYT